MKERPVDLQRTVIAHNESAKVPEPRERAFDRPASFVAWQDTYRCNRTMNIATHRRYTLHQALIAYSLAAVFVFIRPAQLELAAAFVPPRP
jgi:hypothetical protein